MAHQNLYTALIFHIVFYSTLFTSINSTVIVTAYDGTGVSQQQPLTMQCNYTKDTSDVVISFRWTHGSTIIVLGSVSAQTVGFQKGTLWSSGVFLGDFVSSLTIQLPASSVSTSVAGQYSCILDTLTGVVQDTTTATIYYAPQISGFPSTKSVTESSRLQIDFSSYTTAGNPSTTSYRWTYRESTVSSVSVLDINNINRTQSGQYTCTVNNTAGSDSATVSVDVQYGPEQVDITLPDNTAAIENRDLTLTCTATSHPAPTFTWDYTDGSSTGGSPGSVTSLPGSRWSQTLTFRPDRNRQTVRCLARNPRTSLSQSTTITLDVKYPPDESPSITQFKSTMFEGDTGERITCSVVGGNPLAGITWSCPETGTPSVSESGQTRTSTLTFTVTRGQNGQQCRCRGSWQYGGYDQSDVRMFNVSYPPSKPTLTPSVVCEGQAMTSLGCSSTDLGNPPATYTWTKNSSPVSPGFIPVRSDDGATVRCSAGNIFTQRPGHSALQSDPRTLTVHYSPAIELPGTVTKEEGDTLSVICVSHSNPSTKDSEIRWMFHGAEIQQGARLLKSDVSRHDSGVYQCTATVNSQTCGQLQGVQNMSVVVNYAPNVSLVTADITEGETLTLTCQAEGRPVSYNFGSFTQFWGDTEIQTRVGSKTADTYTLRIDSASYIDSGVYECSVDNGVTDTSGNLIVQRKRVDVSVRGRPKFTKDFKSRVGSEVGHDTTLYQTFYSQENCTYNWTFSGQPVGSKYTSSLTPAEVTLDVYGRTVQDSGWNVTLNIVNFQENNQGVYTVTVCNSLGCISSGVNLTAAGPPLIPLDFYVVNTTKSSIFLQWKRNFPGGDFIQVFILHYRKLGDSDWKTLEREDNSNGFVSADVTGLQSGVKYEFKVRAVSNREIDNMSPFTDIITNQTLDQNNQASRDVEPSENPTYSSIDRRMENSEYVKLETSTAQQYSQLRVYDNFKNELSKDVAVYDGLQERKNLPYETMALHQYENLTHKKEDPAYANTKESLAT